MKIKRSICAFLLCLCIVLCGVSSSFAFSASESNAVASFSDALKMDNAKEFKVNYVPLKSASLRSSVPTVSNTVERSNISVRFYTVEDGDLGSLRMGTNGRILKTADHNISNIRIYIPHECVPSYGSFKMSCGMRGNVTPDILSVYIQARSEATGAAPAFQTIIENSDITKSYGDFYMPPTAVDFGSFDQIVIQVNFNTTSGSRTLDSTFSLRYEKNDDTSVTPVEIGNPYDSAGESAAIAENTSQLVYSQNETNGLLEDIIQHISDQLAAMWDQIYNLMAVPWIQNDNQRTNNTIEAIEDSSESTNTTIEQQSSWHANFIIDGLKSLFIPSETYFSTTITDLFDWFEDKFGFLGYTLTYFIRLLNGIVGASQNTVIRFPGITVPNRATNETYQILPAQDVDIAAQISLISDNDFNLLEFMRTAGDIVLVLGFIVMLQNKLHEVESR